jgi:hypothetical protein
MRVNGFCHVSVRRVRVLLVGLKTGSDPEIIKTTVMKRVSLIRMTSLFLGVLLVSTALFQCRKTGDLAGQLNRSYTAPADSTVYASFYDNHTIGTADAVPDVNDIIKVRGVQTIMWEYCGTSNCHGGAKDANGATIPGKVKPQFGTYADIMKYVTPGNPGASKFWDYVTTNDFDEAMPPVNTGLEMNTRDKSILYNWIVNGAREFPDIKDFRPAAIRLIMDGCGSANCHNQATATGGWARNGLLTGPPYNLISTDTGQYTYVPPTGTPTVYAQLTNLTLMRQVWNDYKDSVKRFYSDTLANASFRPYKIFALPISSLSTRGPLMSYDDILMDIMYPKGQRSRGAGRNQTTAPPSYVDPVSGKSYWVLGDPYVFTDCFLRQVDSTLIYRVPRTLAETTKGGGMAYDDGGLTPSEIALIKAWYFADPNVPEVWKYGFNNQGIFKYRKTNTWIIRR